MERRIEQINKFKSGREGLKARDIEKKYPPHKAKKLISLLREKQLFYWDEDFPGDEEELLLTKSEGLGGNPKKRISLYCILFNRAQ